MAILSSSGKGDALADELGGLGVTVANRPVEDLTPLVEETGARQGRVDAVVNCAGRGPNGPPQRARRWVAAVMMSMPPPGS